MCAELPLLESALHLCLCKHHSKWSNSRKLSALIMSTWTQFCWLETVYLLNFFSRNCQFQLVAVIYLVCSFFSKQTQSVSANSSVGSAGWRRFSRVSPSSSLSSPGEGRGRRFSLWPQVAPCLFIFRRRPARPPVHLKVVRLNNAFSMWMILWQYRQIHASNGVFHIIILEVYTPLEEISCANFVCLVLFVSFCWGELVTLVWPREMWQPRDSKQSPTFK